MMMIIIINMSFDSVIQACSGVSIFTVYGPNASGVSTSVTPKCTVQLSAGYRV
jgi:hypothetical protein